MLLSDLSFRPIACVLAVTATLVLAGGFLEAPEAQEQIGLETTEPLDLDPVPEDASQSTWDIRLGLLGAGGPEYEGADSYRFAGVPYARISWKERVIFRGRSIEANLYRVDGFRFGPMLRTRGGRNEAEGHVLEGMGDVDRAFEAGAFARVNRGPLRVRVNVVHDVADAHGGMLVEFVGTIGIPFEVPKLSLRLSSSWADDNYMASYFGINAAQSRRSGLRAFNAGAGFKDVGLSAGSRIGITAHWSALVSLGYSYLLRDAADSPIVTEHGTRHQFYTAVGALYRF